MVYNYKTRNTCSTNIAVELDGDVVKNVVFTGGCNGNLQAVPRRVQGLTIAQVEERLAGIHCGFRDTSCADQLIHALKDAYAAQKKEPH